MRRTRNRQVQASLLGLGLDGDDEHKRLTRGDNFVLWGGSAETHSHMQEIAIKFNERLEQRGKRLEDLSPNEFRDMMQENGD